MNKLLIGLLVVAAGAGTFLLLRKKKDLSTTNELRKEWIVGIWKTAAAPANDSTFSKYRYNFKQEGTVLRSLSDSSVTDTSHYEWNKASQLVWKEKTGDSTGKIYSITKLSQDSLLIQAADSSMILFTKVK